MPRYYFHVRNTVVLDDPEGRECRDAAAAREHAIAECRELAAHDVRDGQLNLSHRVEVADEHGITLLVIAFGEAVNVER